MKKHIAATALLLFAAKADTPSLPLQQQYGSAPQTQTLSFTNESDRPILVSALIQKHKDLGLRGFIVPANSQQDLELEEFYWFSRVASGGFGKGNVTMTDVLNHGFADTLVVQIPNQPPQTFPLKEADYIISASLNDEHRVILTIELKK